MLYRASEQKEDKMERKTINIHLRSNALTPEKKPAAIEHQESVLSWAAHLYCGSLLLDSEAPTVPRPHPL